ncbi:MAG: GFA family protein [Rhodobacteraceae bacterium]|nr:GFA family protein [Paracoccaceae bacterium]
MRMGGCLCGAVRYETRVLEDQVLSCHCGQCARTSGHHAVMVACDDAGPVVDDAKAKLRWYRSSPQADRGFCSGCGGNLFWRDLATGRSYVTLGTLDRPTGLAISRHIFVQSKSDYYEITDGLPQSAEW